MWEDVVSSFTMAVTAVENSVRLFSKRERVMSTEPLSDEIEVLALNTPNKSPAMITVPMMKYCPFFIAIGTPAVLLERMLCLCRQYGVWCAKQLFLLELTATVGTGTGRVQGRGLLNLLSC